jgi:putative FmdB family regulatory protein
MPLYEYQCESCAKRFERIQKYSDPPIETCPSCGAHVKKLMSSPAIQFKGSGFYITDYPKKSQSDRDKSQPDRDKAQGDSGKSQTDSAGTTKADGSTGASDSGSSSPATTTTSTADTSSKTKDTSSKSKTE